MNKSIHYLALLLACCLPAAALAHNPLSARYHLDTGQQPAVLTIHLSQDGINHTLLKTHDREALEAMSQQEFETLIVDYLKRNFSMSVNGNRVILGGGGIKVGSHQTDLKFLLPSVPGNLERIEVDIPAFTDNENHQTIFSYRVAGKSEHRILNATNGYRASITFVPVGLEDVSAVFWAFPLSIALLATGFVLIGCFRRGGGVDW